eukprot:gene8006-13915_t
MSSGNESELDNVYLTRNSSADYEQLCSLDILGLSDNPEELVMECTGKKSVEGRSTLLRPKASLPSTTIEEHLKRYEDNYPMEKAEIRHSLYVDDLICGGVTIEEVKHLKIGKITGSENYRNENTGTPLALLPNQTAEEFLLSLKNFIVRRGRTEKLYSVNGRPFVAGANRLKKVMRDEAIQNMLARREIKWQFNLSRAPWWGGQFERMVGLVKQALYKIIGCAVLTWKELTEVMLDIEITLNSRPLSYVEDDIQLPTLTPNVLVYGGPHTNPEQDADRIEDKDLRNRARYLKRCKNMVWNRWTGEYNKALRERHNMKKKTKNQVVKEGEIVIIKNDERKRGRWDLGIIVKLIKGRDGVVQAAKLRAGKSYLERPIQHLYPLELSCDM